MQDHTNPELMKEFGAAFLTSLQASGRAVGRRAALRRSSLARALRYRAQDAADRHRGGSLISKSMSRALREYCALPPVVAPTSVVFSRYRLT